MELGLCTCTPRDSNDETHSPRRKRIPSGRKLSDSSFLHLSPCQSQNPWGGQGLQPQGNPGGTDGAAWWGPRGPRGGVTLRFRMASIARRPESQPTPRSKPESQGLEPVGPRRDPHVQTTLLHLVATRTSPGRPASVLRTLGCELRGMGPFGKEE